MKDSKHGWEGQLAMGYTGKRLSDISNWADNDIWEKGYTQLDASIEKTLPRGFCLFLKASNLLNIPVLRYVHQSERTANVDSERDNSNLVERKSWHGQSLMIGARFRL